MKNKRVIFTFLCILLFVESLIILFGFIFYRDIKYKKKSLDSYEIKFQNGACVFVEMNDDGFKTVCFDDERKNHGFISFENSNDGYFYIYNSGLDFAIDNRLSDKKDFLFQRLERYKNKSSFYYIDYDDIINIEELQIPSIENYEDE